MKKSKLTLALVASFTAVMALSACDDVTAEDGVVLTYTDSKGNKTPYTAKELLESYEQGSSAASTNFKKVKEVLIRKYYEKQGGTTLDQLKTKAQNSVDSIKKQAQSNADSNGTSYATELETLLNSNSVKNISELYEAKLYEEEEKDFERQYKDDKAVESMKTGVVVTKNQVTGDYEYSKESYFKYSDEYGRGSDGYLIEKTPYHVSHFLVKFSASDHSESCQFTITKAESQKISTAVKSFAGAKNEDGSQESSTRQSFGEICYTLPSDDTSSTDYGNLGLMSSDYVSEFRLGVYAYDALYNQQHTKTDSYALTKTTVTGSDKDALEIREHVLPSSSDTFGPNGEPTRDYFEKLGIGTIPYGAAVALGYEDVASDPNLSYSVNDGNATYYPRNVLFNKYFNNRSIAVIVPEDIPFNEQYASYKAGKNYTTAEAETFVEAEKTNYKNGRYTGTYSEEYAKLPGFQVDTKDVVSVTGKDANGNDVKENVLTNERGQIILAVKASNSSGNAYEGLHFIVINRSALDNYVKYSSDNINTDKGCYTTYDTLEQAIADGGYQQANGSSTADTTSLSEYFTVETPSSKNFPKYDGTKTKSTFVNRMKTQEANYAKNAETISNAVKNYNSSEDTYEFQKLMEDGSLKFNTDGPLGSKVKTLIDSYIRSTREKNYENEVKTLDDTWDTYAEALERQNEDRYIGDGKQRLISECVAISYLGTDAANGTGIYDTEGIGYDGK